MWRPLALFVLAAAVVASALGVIEARHRSRMAFAELRALEVERNHLQTEWRQLVLEERAHVSMGEVERLAQGRLDMRRPDPQEVVLVRLPHLDVDEPGSTRVDAENGNQ